MSDATFGSTPQDVTVRTWRPDLKPVEVMAVELRCDLPHSCPECGTSWEPQAAHFGSSGGPDD